MDYFNFNFIDRNVDRFDGCVYTVTNAHRGIINAIDTVGNVENRGASEILTGGQDGLVKVWDPRCHEAVVQIEPTGNVSMQFNGYRVDRVYINCN